MTTTAASAPELLVLRSKHGRLALTTLVLGSGIAILDGTVVNIAARTIGEDLDAGLVEVQWVLNGYLLALASLILVGASLGDRRGRKRIYLIGIAAFGVASVLCALAQDPTMLIVFRVIQGIAAAMLAPGALALIQSSFRPEDRPAAIGAWAGYSGVATAIGPFLGGFLVENFSWRWIFAINVPLCVLVIWLARCVPESRDEQDEDDFDLLGAVLGTVALGVLTYVVTSWRDLPVPVAILGALLAVAAGVAFVMRERRPGAMVPMELFASRVFTAANLMTFLVYGALGAVIFLLVLQLQVTSGYSPLEAGISTLPITVAMLLFSSRSAAMSARIGPRLPMTVGPLLAGAGVLLLAFIGDDASYVVHVLPGMVLFAAGLTTLVSPLTTAVLAAAPDRHAGVASGVNNAVARAGSLLAVAALPPLIGLMGSDYQNPHVLSGAYQRGELICAALLAAGGIVSWIGLRGTPAPASSPSPGEAAGFDDSAFGSSAFADDDEDWSEQDDPASDDELESFDGDAQGLRE